MLAFSGWLKDTSTELFYTVIDKLIHTGGYIAMVSDAIHRCLKVKERNFLNGIKIIGMISLMMIFTCGAYASSNLSYDDYTASQRQTYSGTLENGSDLKVDMDYKRSLIDFKALNFSASALFTVSLTGRNFSLRNDTTLRINPGIGEWKLNATINSTGRNVYTGYEEPNTLVIGPWAQSFGKWSVSLSKGTTSIVGGHTTIPVLSSQLMSGRSLYGTVISHGGKITDSILGTWTFVYGLNNSTYAFSSGTNEVMALSLDGTVNNKISYSTGYLKAKDLSKGLVDVSALGLSLNTPIGDSGISLGADVAYAYNRVAIKDFKPVTVKDSGFSAMLNLRFPFLNGRGTAAVAYSSPKFRSLNSSFDGGKGGVGEASLGWSGQMSFMENYRASLSLNANVSSDNINKQVDSTNKGVAGNIALNLSTPWINSISSRFDIKKENTGSLNTTFTLSLMKPITFGNTTVRATANWENSTLSYADTGKIANNRLSFSADTQWGRNKIRFNVGYKDTKYRPDTEVFSRECQVAVNYDRPFEKINLSTTFDVKYLYYFSVSRNAENALENLRKDTVEPGINLTYNYSSKVSLGATYRHSFSVKNWDFENGWSDYGTVSANVRVNF